MRQKTIVLNGRFTGTKQPTGTQTVAFHLFDKIIRQNALFELVVFADPRFPGVAEWAKHPKTRLIPVPLQDWSRNRAQLWEQFQLSGLCRKHGCDLVHHPITTSPARPGNYLSVVTLHDLNFLLHPEWYSKPFRLAYAFCALPGLKKATRIVTISDYVLEQAKANLGLPAEKFCRIYNGVKPMEAARNSSIKTSPYILCVGSLPPHKNLVRIVQSFLLLKEKIPQLELHVVGRPHPKLGREDNRLATLLEAPGVKILGYLSNEALADAYANAAVYCYPSLEEGFGLPILEAMMLNTPVVTSNRSCLPEIAGPAAFLVDPYSVESIAQGLEAALKLSPEERSKRTASGREWASQFNWSASAQAYLNLYQEILE